LISKDQSESSHSVVCRYTHDLGNDDLLESNWPWPWVAEVEPNREGPVDKKHSAPLHFNPDKHRRCYVCCEPSKATLDMLHPPGSDPHEMIWSHIIRPQAGSEMNPVVITSYSSVDFFKACRSGLPMPDDHSGNTLSPIVHAALQILGAAYADISVRFYNINYFIILNHFLGR
jgi:hypothetical protein